MKNPCTLYIVRHGEVENNVKELLNGQQDSPLTQNGIQQAEALHNEFKDINFTAIYTSDLKRAQKTANIIKGGRPIKLEIEKNLRERYYGKYEGQPKALYKEALEKTLASMNDFSEEAKWKARPSDDVESRTDLIERVTQALKNIAQKHPNREALIISHGACISSFLIHLGEYKPHELPIGSFENCGYVKVLCDGKNFKVEEVVGVKKTHRTDN